jgi:hypothetical protein
MTSQLSKRVTIDIEPDLYTKLTLKAAQADCSVSDIVHEAVYLLLAEDAEDTADFDARRDEPSTDLEL